MSTSDFMKLQESFTSRQAFEMWQELINSHSVGERYEKYRFILDLERGVLDWPEKAYEQAGPAQRELIRVAYFRGLAKRG